MDNPWWGDRIWAPFIYPPSKYGNHQHPIIALGTRFWIRIIHRWLLFWNICLWAPKKHQTLFFAWWSFYQGDNILLLLAKRLHKQNRTTENDKTYDLWRLFKYHHRCHLNFDFSVLKDESELTGLFIFDLLATISKISPMIDWFGYYRSFGEIELLSKHPLYFHGSFLSFPYIISNK